MSLFKFGCRLALFAVVVALCDSRPSVFAQEVSPQKVEAAMTLQILTFAEWPDLNLEKGDTIRVGVFENEALFLEMQRLLSTERYQGQFSVTHHQYRDLRESIDGLDAIYFSKSDPREISRLIKRLEAKPIVFIGAFDGVLELGGMVNFTIRQKRLGFEINTRHAALHYIKFRSKLLRLASRIIEE